MNKKLLAIFTSLMLLTAVIPAGLISANAEVDYTVLENSDTEQQVTQEVVTALGTNLLSGCVPVCYPDTLGWTNNGTKLSSIADAATVLTDGIIHSGMASQFIISDTYSSNALPCISFDMGKVYDVSDIVVGSTINKSNDLGLASYEIYISDFKEGLFTSANMVATYTNDPQTFQNAIEADSEHKGYKYNTHAATVIKFNDGCEKTGRYFGIKILKGSNGLWGNDKKVQLSELGVYGAVSNRVPKNYQIINNTKDGRNVSQATFEALGTSIIAGKIATTNVSVSDSDNLLLTDGAIFNKSDDQTTYIGMGSSKKPTFTYDLGKVYDVNKVAVCGACMGSKDLSFAQYEIYIGDSADTLYTPANLVAEYDSGTIFDDAVAAGQNGWTNMIGAGQYFTFTEAPQGRYLGIKALKTNYFDSFLHLSEFAAYGTVVAGKEIQEAPAAPIVAKRASEYVTLTDTEGYEYSMDGINWRTSPTFRRLVTGVDYTFYQRIAETETAYASDKSEALTVRLYAEGDIDHDGAVDATDLSRIKKHLLGAENASDLFAADVNLDGQIDIRDIVRIKNILSGKSYPNKKYIALTFDDGPNTDNTDLLLDKLSSYNIPATFMLKGSNINEQTASVIKRIASMNHEIGNHSFEHTTSLYTSGEEYILDDYNKTEDLIKKYANVSSAFYRPPFILVNDVLRNTIPVPLISGTGCNDWEDSVSSAERAETIISKISEGGIILLHDTSGNTKTVEALDTIIPALQNKGYTFVTVTDLFEKCNITASKGVLYKGAYQAQ